MSTEQKDEYYKMAKETTSTKETPENSWKEALRIMKNMQSNVCKL